MLERASPAAGTRLMAPTASPSTRMMRLSPCAHLRQVALDDERLAEGVLEDLEERGEVLVAAGDAEDAGAAVAVERLDDDVAVLLAEGARSAPRSRVISVGGVRSGNSVTKSFSGALRTCAGSLTTSVFGWMRSRRCVVVM